MPPALTEQRTAPDDLALSGAWADWPDGEVRYVSREALAAMSGVKTMTDQPISSIAPAEVTVLPLADLVTALGMSDGADGVVLKCDDRWESWLPLTLIEEMGPYLILYYNGKAPGEGEGWPIIGGKEAMAPYHAYVSPTERPDFVDASPYGMISATQVIEVHAASAEERYAPFYAGALGELDGVAAEGRELFLANCNTCHQGPGGIGGNLSLRPFILLQTHATLNAAYFRQIVRDPTTVYPDTIMPKHAQFTDEHLVALEAFLAAAKDAGVQ